MSKENVRPPWYPVAASASLQAGRSVDAVWAGGSELVVWRSASGLAQAWDNRCPHRSVRLSIGQVAGERLACAYHGWQFDAGSGACAVLPAHPGQPAPAQVRVRVWGAVEADGMVWVNADPGASNGPPRAGSVGVSGSGSDIRGGALSFCRSLAIRRDAADVLRRLVASGWVGDSAIWHGAHDGWSLRAFVQDARAELTIAHCWVQMPVDGSRECDRLWPQAHAALRDLRQCLEAPTCGR